MLNQHYSSFLVKRLWDYRFTASQSLSRTKWVFIQIAIIHDNISSQVADKRREGLGQWMNASIIHDNIHSFTYYSQEVSSEKSPQWH